MKEIAAVLTTPGSLALIFFVGATVGGLLRLWFRKNRLRRQSVPRMHSQEQAMDSKRFLLRVTLVCLVIALFFFLLMWFLPPVTFGIGGALLTIDLQLLGTGLAGSIGYAIGVSGSFLVTPKKNDITIGMVASSILRTVSNSRLKVAARIVAMILVVIGLFQLSERLVVVGLVLFVLAKASREVVDFLSVLALMLSESASALLNRRR